MFGLAYLVISAEREWRDKAAKTYDEEGRLEAQVWFWRHKMLFLVIGVLALLIIGGNAI